MITESLSIPLDIEGHFGTLNKHIDILRKELRKEKKVYLLPFALQMIASSSLLFQDHSSLIKKSEERYFDILEIAKEEVRDILKNFKEYNFEVLCYRLMNTYQISEKDARSTIESFSDNYDIKDGKLIIR